MEEGGAAIAPRRRSTPQDAKAKICSHVPAQRGVERTQVLMLTALGPLYSVAPPKIPNHHSRSHMSQILFFPQQGWGEDDLFFFVHYGLSLVHILFQGIFKHTGTVQAPICVYEARGSLCIHRSCFKRGLQSPHVPTEGGHTCQVEHGTPEAST